MQIQIDDFSDYDKVGILKKKDLKVTENLKRTFNLINQHLYGKLKHTDTGTRARSHQIINLLLCKLYDEVNKVSDEYLEFQIFPNEKEEELLNRLQIFFNNNLKQKFKNIIVEEDNIKLNKELVYLIVEKLQFISLLNSSKDILSDAYEIFVSRTLKEEGGQFFTPPNVVEFMVKFLDPKIESKIMDPACGHGGFLLESKSLVWSKIERRFKHQNDLIEKKKRDLISNLHGIDKDSFLARISKLYLEILSKGKSNIFCEDSLDFDSYSPLVKQLIKNDSFDYVFTNPPFGAKIPIDIVNILRNYKLGHIWKNIPEDKWKMEKKLVKKQPPQILFIERCVQLLKDGGKLGIILPEGIFGNPSNRYIWEFLDQQGKILGIVSLDQNTFQPYTCNKTSILFFQKLKEIPVDYKIDFAIVENVGHDKDGKILYKLDKDGSKKRNSNGDFIINDNLINLHIKLREAEEFNFLKDQKLFKINFSQIKNYIFIPAYYTGVEKILKKLESSKSFVLLTLRDLIKKRIVYTNKNSFLPRGNEIGSHVYGLGEVPFIRTSEIYDWEINLNSYKKTSEEVYNQYKDKQNIEEGDILLVKDGGPNLIGNTAYITELDTKIIIQSHIFQIKILENNQEINPFLMLYLLNLDIVLKQIKAITFIQGTIATIGNRLMDVILPIPANIEKRKEITDYIKNIIEDKTRNRRKIYNLSLKTFNFSDIE